MLRRGAGKPVISSKISSALHFTFALVMTTLPIASYCSADAAPPKTSQCCADKKAEIGELFIPLRHYRPDHGSSLSGVVITPTTISNETPSSDKSDKETVPFPLAAVIPKERLPDVLDVYDNDIFRRIGAKYARGAPVNGLEKFLASGPIRYVRKFPVRIPTTLRLQGEGIFFPAPPSSLLYIQT
jgi:hypothetical protein